MNNILEQNLIKNNQTENIKQIKYYEELGFTEAQSAVLGLFLYSTNETNCLLNFFKNKCKQGEFCETVYKFILNKIEKNDEFNFRNIPEFNKPIKIKNDNFFSNLFKSKSSKRGSSSYSMPSFDENDTYCINVCSSSSYSNIKNNVINMQKKAAKSGYSPNLLRGQANIVQPISAQPIINQIIEDIRYDTYNTIEEKGFKNVLNNPTSTFRTTCNTASLGIVKNNVLKGYNINKSMVRTEELMNYFKYNLKTPEKEMFEINTEVYNIGNNKQNLFIGIQGKNKLPEKQNIVLLLDVSGSMHCRQIQMQTAIFTIISKLKKGDIISLITYSNEDTSIFTNEIWDENSLDEIIKKFLKIQIDGCTYGSKGLTSAYELIEKNKIKDGINRVVIFTDGDFNFGTSSNDGIEKLILEKKKTGAYLSVVGTGTWNLNDHLMETLAKNGNGNYVAVNSLDDVYESIYKNYNSLMHTIALDVKAQVEFNPKYVKSYRLIGYENRELNHEDFTNDKVISEPFGSGGTAIALYELEMADGTEKSDLKYQKQEIINSNEICTVKVRYKELNEENSKEIIKEVLNEENYTSNLKLAVVIGNIGEKLRESEYFNKDNIFYNEFVENKLSFEDLKNDDKIIILKELIK